MEIEIVSEGIETEEQQYYPPLKECHFFQGFLFSKPLTLVITSYSIHYTKLYELERCDATIVPQILRDGRKEQFQVILSVTKRAGQNRPPS